MVNRIAILIAIAFLYVAIRFFIYHHVVPVINFGKTKDRFDYWWAWGAAAPATALVIITIIGTVNFLVKGTPL